MAPHAPTGGNPELITARHARGWYSQQRFADAFASAARAHGLNLTVSVRQVRRWESAGPPWPTPDYQLVLEALFDRPLADLGFRRPCDGVDAGTPATASLIRRLRTEAVTGWWRGDGPDETPIADRLTEVERSSASVRTFEVAVIPGLLQTFEYALAVIRASCPALPTDEIVARAHRRTERLDRMGKNGRRLLSFVIDESALYRPVGGAGCLQEQLAHILTLTSRRPDLHVQVLPLGAGAHAGTSGPFVLFDLASQRIAAREDLAGISWTVRPSCLAHHFLAYDRLQAAALPVDASMERIARRLSEMEIACTSGSPVPTVPATTVWRSPASTTPPASGTPR